MDETVILVLQDDQVNFLKAGWINLSMEPAAHCTTDCFQDRQWGSMWDQKLISAILLH